jgi:NAD(P)-dependent dehydrogenase (short-subunit alcohol dehydrogenase family)
MLLKLQQVLGSDGVELLRDELRRHAGHSAIDLIIADAFSVRENLRVAHEVARRAGHADVLVNNVGGGAGFAERRETPEGLEANLALNFVGPFALTTKLLQVLPIAPGRIVNVVSSAFQMWKRDPFEDVGARTRYVAIQAHAHAKLLNLLFTLALARRLADVDASVTAVNPGMAWTPGVASLTPQSVPQWRLIWPVVRWIQRKASAESAAHTVAVLATSETAPPSGGTTMAKREGNCLHGYTTSLLRSGFGR